jgi:hypothetical protein
MLAISLSSFPSSASPQIAFSTGVLALLQSKLAALAVCMNDAKPSSNPATKLDGNLN